MEPSMFLSKEPITNPSKLLLRYGFWKKEAAEKYNDLSDQELDEKIRSLSDEDAEKDADEHHLEIATDQMLRTGYPKPAKSYYLVYETFQKPVEAFYFWCINSFKDLGFPEIEKIQDLFAASEQSAFYGAAAQRLGLTQDRVVQYIASIGKMVRELFQMVREIRIIKERLMIYQGTLSEEEKTREHFEVTLKGLYVDMVEGGAKNTKSVFGMASQLQFTALPDLFFSTNPKSVDDVAREVDKLEFNDRLKNILKRKLTAYMTWKQATFQELKDRENHMIKYLRQHYDMIQLYMQWVKPYLRFVKRLHMDKKRIESADLVGAFEGSVVEVEVLAKTMPQGNKEVYGCILLNLVYRTSPTMSFAREGRHQGPVHMGRVELTWRAYAWDQKTIDRYRKLREEETFQMLGEIDESVREAMAGVGDALEEYIREARMSARERDVQPEEKPKKKKTKRPSFLQELGLEDITGDFKKLFWEDTADKAKSKKKTKESKAAAKSVDNPTWLHYRNFKKANKLITW